MEKVSVRDMLYGSKFAPHLYGIGTNKHIVHYQLPIIHC